MSYRFYDPRYPKPKQVIIKGMNDYKELTDRQIATQSLYDNEIEKLEGGYNPRTGALPINQETQTDEVSKFVMAPDTPFIAALRRVIHESHYSSEVKIDLRSVLKYTGFAALKLKIESKPINTIKKREIRAILKVLPEIKEKWSNRTHNYYKAHLSMIFKYLFNEDVIEYNPVDGIELMQHTVGKRDTLTDEQRIMIDDDLRKDNFGFWMFMQIFFHSGSRTTELLKVQEADVDLVKQEVEYLVKKGKVFRRVKRPIKDSVLIYWRIALSKCAKGKNQYVFSEGLVPGDLPIRREQISRRWRRWVKNKKDANGNPKYGENVPDWYSLKHLNSTETAALIGKEAAAQHNAHSLKIFEQVYDVKAEERNAVLVRKLPNSFVPIKLESGQ